MDDIWYVMWDGDYKEMRMDFAGRTKIKQEAIDFLYAQNELKNDCSSVDIITDAGVIIAKEPKKLEGIVL